MLVIKVALCVGLLSGTQTAAVSSRPCPSDIEKHWDKNRLQRLCCRTVTCGLGQRAQICPSYGEAASCVSCGKNQYMDLQVPSNKMRSCKTKRSCNFPGMIVEDDGDLTTDRKCACDLSRSFFDPHNCTVGDCLEICRRKNCPAGQESDKYGSCVPCTMGHFKAQSGFDRCVMKTHCNNHNMKFRDHGNFTHDSVCVNHTTTEDHAYESGDHPRVLAIQSKPTQESEEAHEIYVGVGVGVLVGVGVPCVLGVVIVCLCRRKRSSRTSEDIIPEKKCLECYSEEEAERLSTCSIVVSDPPPTTARSPLMEHTTSHNENTQRKDFISNQSEDSGLDVDGSDIDVTRVKQIHSGSYGASPQASPEPPQSPPSQSPPSRSPPSRSPPAQSPPAQSPPSRSPSAQSPPAQSPPSRSLPAQSPPAQSPPAQSPTVQSPPAHSPPAQSPPAQLPPHLLHLKSHPLQSSVTDSRPSQGDTVQRGPTFQINVTGSNAKIFLSDHQNDPYPTETDCVPEYVVVEKADPAE